MYETHTKLGSYWHVNCYLNCLPSIRYQLILIRCSGSIVYIYIHSIIPTRQCLQAHLHISYFVNENDAFRELSTEPRIDTSWC